MRSWCLAGQQAHYARPFLPSSLTASASFSSLSLHHAATCVRLVLSRLEYCNEALVGLLSTTLDPLRWVLNAAVTYRWSWSSGPCAQTDEEAPLVTNQIPYQIINFTLCLMMHPAVTVQCPQHICDIVLPLPTLPGQNRLQAAVIGQFEELFAGKELSP